MLIFGSFSSDECVTTVAQRTFNRTSRMPESGTYGSVGGPARKRRADPAGCRDSAGAGRRAAGIGGRAGAHGRPRQQRRAARGRGRRPVRCRHRHGDGELVRDGTGVSSSAAAVTALGLLDSLRSAPLFPGWRNPPSTGSFYEVARVKCSSFFFFFSPRSARTTYAWPRWLIVFALRLLFLLCWRNVAHRVSNWRLHWRDAGTLYDHRRLPSIRVRPM